MTKRQTNKVNTTTRLERDHLDLEDRVAHRKTLLSEGCAAARALSALASPAVRREVDDRRV